VKALVPLLACTTFCVAFSLVVVVAIFISSGRRWHRFGLPGQIPPRKHPLLTDEVSGRFCCHKCAAAGRLVSFTDAGGLMVHEIQDHPADTWTP
jgi:hypothetical protein